ncbi:MAG: TolC family protein [Acidobacteriota bacterium]
MPQSALCSGRRPMASPRPFPRRPNLRRPVLAAAILILGAAGPRPFAVAPARATPPADPPASPSRALTASLEDPRLRSLVEEALERHPALEAEGARAEALRHVAPRVRSLPDPTVSLTAFPLPPETRVGPQRGSLGVQQRLPSRSRLALTGQRAELAAAAADARLEALRVDIVTRARVLWYELGFLAEQRRLLVEERGHLGRHEEVARARYAAGSGLAQGAIKIQAELTRIDTRLLDLDARRALLGADLDALRDRFDVEGPEPGGLPEDGWVASFDPSGLDPQTLVDLALRRRPEMDAARSERRATGSGVELAQSARRPDWSVGLTWTAVEGRDDPAGRASPTRDDGDDILAITGSMSLPIRRRPRLAQLEEALARERAAAGDERRIAAGIRRQVHDLAARLPLEHRQWSLLQGVLDRQAEEAVQSAVAAYATGSLGALDLLDAEHRLFEVRTATARAKADIAIAVARLEGALASPLVPPNEGIPSAEEHRHE